MTTLEDKDRAVAEAGAAPRVDTAAIAIIGMAGRFPGAPTIGKFWDNLCAGVESITHFSKEELLNAGVSAATLEDRRFVPAASQLKDVDRFDADFFGYQPKEAEIMDPQRRLLLECGWEALEDAGYGAEDRHGLTGVFVGAAANTYLLFHLAANPAVDNVDPMLINLGNGEDFLATRLSYKLDLKGPSIAVQTACSTSLVAVHLACQSLLNEECDLALAGGVAVNLSQRFGYRYTEGGVASPDGHCRAFDARGQGTVFGSGVGVVVLKRLADAVAARDNIVCVIKGTAINNDGSLKAGYTAPSVQGQAKVIAEAQAVADVEAGTIGYVEAHGTATAIGDPIELQALSRGFGGQTADRGFCAIGSLKTNVGHLDAAAGVAGLIKAALAVKHRLIPPTLNFERPNPRIDFINSPFYVNTALCDWPQDLSPRRAAVSAFGIGGTNAHAILEEAPPTAPPGPGRPCQLILLSAKTETALESATDRLASHLSQNTELDLADVAYTLQMGRRSWSHRRALLCGDRQEAVRILEARPTGQLWSSLVQDSQKRRVAFLLPDQGSQYVNMGRGLYDHEAMFRGAVDRCSELLLPHLGLDLRTVLYPGTEPAGKKPRLRQTDLAQPALFVTEYALAQWMMACGIRPYALFGHGLGEVVAACLAGVLELNQALQLVATRGRLIQTLPEGVMLVVPLPEPQLKPFLTEALALAAIYAPARCVVSGPAEEVHDLERRLPGELACQRLRTSHAFHSPMMDPILGDLKLQLERLELRPPEIPFVSNLTGTWIGSAEATSPDYWVRQLRQPVLIAEGLGRLVEDDGVVLLETGPGGALATLARQLRADQVVLTSMRHARDSRDDLSVLWQALGRLWLAGVEPDWAAAYAHQERRRAALPTYPFERQRYWIEARQVSEPRPGMVAAVVENEDGSAPSVDGPTSAQQPVEAPLQSDDRKGQVLEAVKGLLSQLSGVDASTLGPQVSFSELGLDSLMLLQVGQAISDRFGIQVGLRQFFEELTTFEALASHIEAQLPPDAPAEATGGPDAADSATAAPGDDAVAMVQGLRDQVQTMARQIAHLEDWLGSGVPSPAPATGPSSAARRASAVPAPQRAAASPFVPHQPLQLEASSELGGRQRRHVENLIDRFTARARRSKETIQEYRSVLANNRSVAGFRLPLKEMAYPIVARQAKGSKFWDVDGNEYVDISMGFGVYLLGHNAPFIQRAVEEELRRGAPIGPFSHDAGRVAELVQELTGVERATFFNSGTEAVMVALRLARAATGRSKVALFSGAFHGTFDGILARANMASQEARGVPIAPGIPEHMTDHVLVLDYDSPSALEKIEAHAHELAAVLVEPVQSRRPDLQPRSFLEQLRRLTARAGVALIFDEVITGFRIEPGGAQAHFGVEADLVTYGKVIGGGMPIGLVAGKAHYLDGIDGGTWQFGDESYPLHDEKRTFAAGTFCQHPLAMAAAVAVLGHLRQQGPELQQRLNRRTAELTETLNSYFSEAAVPMHMVRFGSLFRFVPRGDLELFFYHLIEKGIYVWEGRNCFLSTAHSDEDVERVVEAVRASVEELRSGGFLPDDSQGPTTSKLKAALGSVSTESDTQVPDAQAPGESSPALVPLTEEQKQLWVLVQLSDEASAAYNESIVLRLKGPLRLDPLRQALQRLVDRHEALRLTISPDGESQRIWPSRSIDLELAEYGAADDSDVALAIEERLTDTGSQPFDLAQGPLMRVCLIKKGESEHLLVVVVHHMVADDWSRGVLLEELGLLYTSACAAAQAPLDEATPFRAFVDWRQRQQESLRGKTDYWSNLFAAKPAAVELPTDRPRPASASYTGQRLTVELPSSLYNGLRRLCAEQNATVLMILLSAFTVMLHRLTGQRDIVLGIPTTGQPLMGANNLVGQCTTMLPFYVAMDGDSTFGRHLKAVRSRLFDMVEHQGNVSTGLIAAQRTGARVPPLTVMFNMDRAVTLPSFSDLETELVPFPVSQVKFDLSLNGIEIEKTLQLQFDYRTDLFSGATIECWIQHFQVLLGGIVEAPDSKIGDLPLLTERQRRQRVEVPRGGSEKGESEATIHGRFEQQAARSPQALVAVADDVSLTYEALNREADRFARDLRGRGVRAGQVVALAVGPMSDLPVPLLGVLKAGCAYSILPSHLPGAEREARLADCGADLLVTVTSSPERGGRVAMDEVGVAKSEERFATQGGSDSSLACVLTASGMNGQSPIAVRHRSALEHSAGMKQVLSLQPHDRLLSLDGHGDDGGLAWLIPTLLSGATLLFGETPESLNELHRSILALQATVVDVPLVRWRQLLSSAYNGEGGKKEPLPQGLRCLVRGGAPLAVGHLELWQKSAMGDAGLWFGYEPETVPVMVSAADLAAPGTIDVGARRCPIGRPMPEAQLSILDARLQPVPAGVVGEIRLGAEYLARQRSDSTHLQAALPGDGDPAESRLKSTGTRGRSRPDGTIECLGPAADLVWLGGRSVDLGDIGAALTQHPRIQDAAVLYREAADLPARQLVAYFTAMPDPKVRRSSDPPALDPRAALIPELRQFLRRELPEYMLPGVFVPLDAMPLLDNGTVARHKLPAPGKEHDLRGELHHPPRTAVEEQIAAIWSQLLGPQSIGIHDNFFEVGGHSMLATALAERLRSVFPVTLTLRELFEAPTVAEMAARIEAQLEQTDGASAKPKSELPQVEPQQGPGDQPFPLTDVQQAYWVGRTGAFGLGNVSTHTYYEVETRQIDIQRFQAAWQRLIDRHGMLRASVLPHGEQQILPQPPSYKIEVLDLRGRDRETATAELGAVRERMSHQVLPSDRWPLFEICATQLDDQRLRLHVSIDALIVDAWSMQILFQELSQLYENPHAELPALALSFRDYVLGESLITDTDVYRRSEEYWQRRLLDLPAAPELPMVGDPGSLAKPRFVRWAGRLDPQAWKRLKQRAIQAGVTPSIVILAAYAEALTLWSKSPRFTLNLTLFHRLPLHPQVNEILGDFTSVTLLAIDNTVADSFKERARRIQEQFWEDLDHRYVSGVRVLRQLGRMRRVTHGLLMPVVFTSSLIHRDGDLETSPMSWLGDVVHAITQTPQVWLDHEVYEDAGSLVFTWDVVAELFPAGLMDAMFHAFSTLLNLLVDDEESWLRPWPEMARQLMPQSQLELEAQVNDTRGAVTDHLLHTLFLDQAVERPTSSAVVTSSHRLTYEELARLANRIGRRLLELGAKPNTLVAIVMVKGWEQVAAALGILNAGAAYLPIDPALPRDRILYLLEHGQVSVALTQSWFDEQFPWPQNVHHLCVDGDEWENVDPGPLEVRQAPTDLAYVIFTSGSTGLPKGVMIDHRGAVNTVLDINQRYGVKAKDRVLALSSLSFDLSVYDIFGLLAAGGTIVIPDATATTDPEHWAELMVRCGVTIWNSVPTLMEMLVEYIAGGGTRAALASLRLLMMSGDWIPVTLPEHIRALSPHLHLVSLGGATEASIWSILYDIKKVDPEWTSIPYGTPMVNQTIHVLDESLEPRPVWTPGHLYIGGIGVAKGYWRDDVKTRASFITHPRSRECLYRTGDLGRRLPDGTIEFLGREDSQVKVQGHRIELGEIETTLVQHPAVRAAVAAAVGEERGSRRLVAYVVEHGEGAPGDGTSAVTQEGTVPASDPETLLNDPLARLECKLKQPGLRHDHGRTELFLIRPQLGDREIEAGYIERRSYRAFHGERIAFEQMSHFLACSMQWPIPGSPFPKYRYGSAGSLYPVQMYVYIKSGQVENIDAGLYYYHPRDHKLVLLSSASSTEETTWRNTYSQDDRRIFDAAGFAIFLLGQMEVVQQMYPEDGRRYATLEAGLLTQLLEMNASAAGIGLCQIGGLDFAALRSLFALSESHLLLHTLVGGSVDPQQQTLEAYVDEMSQYESLVEMLKDERATAALPEAVGTEPELTVKLKSWLETKLPPYMVPQTIITLEALPLSSNGKVDRKALPVPDAGADADLVGYLAPETDLERNIVELLQEVLATDRIGVHDNFFDLGGDSVALVRFHARLQALVGERKIPMTAMFQHVTVASLAEYLGGSEPQKGDDRSAALKAGKARLAHLAKRRGS